MSTGEKKACKRQAVPYIIKWQTDYDCDDNARKVSKRREHHENDSGFGLYGMFWGSFVSAEYATADRFANNKDGTVTDTQTGLMWADHDNGANINWLMPRAIVRDIAEAQNPAGGCRSLYHPGPAWTQQCKNDPAVLPSV